MNIMEYLIQMNVSQSLLTLKWAPKVITFTKNNQTDKVYQEKVSGILNRKSSTTFYKK